MKSLRDGKANLVDSYARIQKGEAFLVNAHISPYAGANQFNHEPTRTRKLLLHAHEIERLTGKTKERGLTLIPLKIYFKNGRAKVELGLARGKNSTTSARHSDAKSPSAKSSGHSNQETEFLVPDSVRSCGNDALDWQLETSRLETVN